LLSYLFFDLEDGGDMFLRKVGFHRTARCYIPEIKIVIDTAVKASNPTLLHIST
jgi:hypothetical protein